MRERIEGDAASAGVDRRGFLGGIALAIGGLLAAAAGAVAAVFATAPSLRRGDGRGAGGSWSPVEDATAPPASGPTKHAVRVVSDAGWAETEATYAVFVDAAASGGLVAFSARCPHEGCQVDWDGELGQYLCPCHNSSWTRAGERTGGPTKRGLDPLDVRTSEAGEVEIRYETFVLDTADRIPVA